MTEQFGIDNRQLSRFWGPLDEWSQYWAPHRPRPVIQGALARFCPGSVRVEFVIVSR